MSTSTVHFKINFEFLTNHTRQLWMEGNYLKCIKLLNEIIPSEEQQFAIILGTHKFTQDPNGVEGVDGIIVPDTWKPDLNFAHKGQYPHPDEIFPFGKDVASIL